MTSTLPRLPRLFALASFGSALLGACGGEADYVPPAADGGGGGATLERPLPTERPAASCSVAIDGPVLLASPHVQNDTPITYNSVPPSSGPHFPQWAAFGEHEKPVPAGYLVHALEHGAVALLYRCAGAAPGCVDLAALRAIADATPLDPLCVAPVKHRILLAPEPTLDVPFAAAAWGFTYRADCLDGPTLRAFVDGHYAQGPENLCADGLRL